MHVRLCVRARVYIHTDLNKGERRAVLERSHCGACLLGEGKLYPMHIRCLSWNACVHTG